MDPLPAPEAQKGHLRLAIYDTVWTGVSVATFPGSLLPPSSMSVSTPNSRRLLTDMRNVVFLERRLHLRRCQNRQIS